MRKGIGPRGLGAVKSPAQQTKGRSSDRQKHAEGQIANKYNRELYLKEIAIRRRTYDEMGIGQGYKGSKSSPEYKRTAGIAEGKVQNRMKNNKGPNEIRAKRDAEISASREAYEATSSTKGGKRSAMKQVAKGNEGQTKKKKYDGKITDIKKRQGEPGYTVTVRGSVNPENLKHALKHGKGKRATKPTKTSKGNVIKY